MVEPAYRLFHVGKEKGIALEAFLYIEKSFSLGSVSDATIA
jgi:hypothetical protein